MAILTLAGLSNHERLRWLTRFRAANLAERPALLARFHAKHPAAPAVGEASHAAPLVAP
jgi:hypothetical protein